MSDKRNADLAHQGECENPGANSNDESVLDFLWGSEAPAVPAGKHEEPAQDATEQEDLAGALARYGSWLSSLDGAA